MTANAFPRLVAKMGLWGEVKLPLEGSEEKKKGRKGERKEDLKIRRFEFFYQRSVVELSQIGHFPTDQTF